MVPCFGWGELRGYNAAIQAHQGDFRGWVAAWRVVYLFKHPHSGSKGHLNWALTFPYSIGLLCRRVALLARPIAVGASSERVSAHRVG